MTGVILKGMKTAISLPDPLFEAADQLAKRLHVSRSELYATAIGEYLRLHRDQGITETLDRIYKDEDSSLDPVWVALQAAVLPKDDW
jgi:metal-responsive CopG/Arc/MetJ family transcriptional regulator